MAEKGKAIGPEYVKLHLNSVLEINRIVSLHYFKYVKDFWGPGEAHDFWELVYVDAGEIEATADDKHYILSQGEAIIHRPMEYHNLIARGTFASAFITSFDCFSNSISQLARDEDRILRLNKAQQAIISGILDEGVRAYQRPFDVMGRPMLTRLKNASYGAEQMGKTYLEQLIISLVRSQTEPETAEGPQKHIPRNAAPKENRTRIIDTILTILTENIDQELSLDMICQRMAFSRSYLERLFEEEMGCGIKQYFMQMKVERAKELISERRHSFTEIASMLGFNSIHYFSRTFKKYTDMTPSQYQKSVLNRKLL